MEKMRQNLIADLREVVVIACLTARWEEKGKLKPEESYPILKKAMFKAEGILKILAEKGSL